MAATMWAVAGSFAMKIGAEKGIHIYRYDPETGTFSQEERYRTEINAGQRAYDKEKNVLYVTHEGKDFDGERAGGGRIFAVRVDLETGEPKWLGEARTLATLPSDICIAEGGKYLLVPHHTTRDLVTKTVRQADGSFAVQTVGDDCTLVLFEQKEDGKIGRILDVYTLDVERDGGFIKKLPHLHNCVQAPGKNLFFVCDKGGDVVHAFRIDEESNALVYLNKTFVEEGVHPRYGVFHPVLPYFYQNCENSAFLHVWKYDAETGKLESAQKIALLEKEEEAAAWIQEGASDLTLTADGRYLYAAVRGLNVLAVFEVQKDGTLAWMQNISCEGKNPRGIALSPDERYLFVMNRDSNTIMRFVKKENGMLEADGCAAECELPGNLIFLGSHLK